MATTATQHPTYPTPVQPEGPFGVQGEQPDTGLVNQLRERVVARRFEEKEDLPSRRFPWAVLGVLGASLLLFKLVRMGGSHR